MRFSLSGLFQNATWVPSDVLLAKNQTTAEEPLQALAEEAKIVPSNNIHIVAGVVVTIVVLLLVAARSADRGPGLRKEWRQQGRRLSRTHLFQAAVRTPAVQAVGAAGLLGLQLLLVLGCGSLALLADLGCTAGDVAAHLTAHLTTRAASRVTGSGAAQAPGVVDLLEGTVKHAGPLLAAGVSLSAVLSTAHRLWAVPEHFALRGGHHIATACFLFALVLLAASLWLHPVRASTDLDGSRASRVRREAAAAAAASLLRATPVSRPVGRDAATGPPPAAAEEEAGAEAATTREEEEEDAAGVATPRSWEAPEDAAAREEEEPLATEAPTVEATAEGGEPQAAAPLAAEEEEGAEEAPGLELPARLVRDFCRSLAMLALGVAIRSGVESAHADSVGALVVGTCVFLGNVLPMSSLPPWRATGAEEALVAAATA